MRSMVEGACPARFPLWSSPSATRCASGPLPRAGEE